MSDKTELQRLIQDLYPEEQFSNNELTKVEKDVINFFSLLVNEYMKQKYKKNLLKEPDVPYGANRFYDANFFQNQAF